MAELENARMLDNEPTGGVDAGNAPAGDTADSTQAHSRARTPRKRAKAAPPPAPTGEQVGPAAEPAPEAAEPAPTRRRTPRRTAKAAVPAGQPSVTEPEATTPADVDTAAPLTTESDVEATPVKATRARRRKAAAPPTEAPDGPEAAGTEGPIGGAPPTEVPVDEAPPTGGGVAPGTGERPQAGQAPSPIAVLFMPPEPVQEPEGGRRRRSRPAREAVEATTEGGAPTGRRRSGPAQAEPAGRVAEAEPTEEEEAEEAEAVGTGEGEEAGGRRRRRRGRRGRGRGRGAGDEVAEDETPEPTEAEAEESTEEEAAEGEEAVTRRRRRRRRRGAGDTEPSDEPNVVVKIREPRAVEDEVQGVSGSTRLEAKRQRRRDGRDQRRTRPPILSESEFLARREAVDRVMVVRQKGDRTQVAVLEDGVLVEHSVARSTSTTMVGNVYLGRVQNVLPSMEAAFVDIGRGRNAVLYAGEVNWADAGLSGRGRSIEQALKGGDPVLVQVTKDPVGHKGARLTSHVALSGRHLVYVPGGHASGISRKLSDIERKRLRDILKKLVPEEAGVIVRTAAEGATEEDLARDVTRLQAQWEAIERQAKGGNAPVALYEEPDLVIRVVRDLFNEDFRELVIQGEGAYEMVEGYLAHVSPDLVPRVRRYAGTGDAFAEMRIDEQLLKALDRKVYLPSGGSLVIDRTEAMTVIDVNTGKFTGRGGNLEETVTKNNLEAAEEIVRQLRLRDVGGIIVIDFIDMVLESNRELVLRRLTECLGRDRTKHQVTEITSLGLVQMTRKRMGQGLLDAFSETCEHCKGRGIIVHLEPVPERKAPETPAEKSSEGSRPEGRAKSRRRRGRAEEAEPVEAVEPGVPGKETEAASTAEVAPAESPTAAGSPAPPEPGVAGPEDPNGHRPVEDLAAAGLSDEQAGEPDRGRRRSRGSASRRHGTTATASG